MFNDTKTKAMSELKVGTKVRIKADLVEGKEYGKDTCVYLMMQYLGMETEISRPDNNGFRLKWCSIWSWTPEMFDVIE